MMRLLVTSLIRLFPADFRDSYGADLIATFDDRWRERPGFRAAARTPIDLAHSAFLERRTTSKGDRSIAVALAACWIPAWRATQVATTQALRAE